VKVRIDAGGRAIEIECADANVSVDTVGSKALKLWQETAATSTEGPGYGFTPQLASPPSSRYLEIQPLKVNVEDS